MKKLVFVIFCLIGLSACSTLYKKATDYQKLSPFYQQYQNKKITCYYFCPLFEEKKYNTKKFAKQGDVFVVSSSGYVLKEIPFIQIQSVKTQDIFYINAYKIGEINHQNEWGLEENYSAFNSQMQKQHQEITKKTGYSWCQPAKDNPHNLDKNQNNCLFEIKDEFEGIGSSIYKVVAQHSKGTIIYRVESYHHQKTPDAFFIEKNAVDSNQEDNSIIPAGIFLRTGIFSYENLNGGRKTIKKIKRLQ